MLTRKTLLVLLLVFCRHGGSISASSVELSSSKRQKARQRGKKMQTRRGPQRNKKAKKTKTNKRGRKTAKKAAPALVSSAPTSLVSSATTALVSSAPNAEPGPTVPFWPTAGRQSSLPASSDELGATNFPLVANETTIEGDLVPVVCQRETNFGRVMGEAVLKAVPSADIALISCGDFQANIPGRMITRADVRRGLRDKKHLVVLKLTGAELLADLEKALSQKPGFEKALSPEPGIGSWEYDFFKQVGGVFLRFTTERPGLHELTKLLTPSRITFLQIRKASSSSVVTVVEDSKLAVPPNEEFVVVTTTSGMSTGHLPGTLLFHTNVSTQDALEQHIIDVGVLNVSDPPENPAISRETLLPQPPARCASYERGYTNIFLDDEDCFNDFIGPNVATTCEDFTDSNPESCRGFHRDPLPCGFRMVMPGFEITAAGIITGTMEPLFSLYGAVGSARIDDFGDFDGFRRMRVLFSTSGLTIISLRFWCGLSGDCTGARIIGGGRATDLSHLGSGDHFLGIVAVAPIRSISLYGWNPSLILDELCY